MDGAVAQAALKTSLVPNPLAAMTTKMNPLGQGGTGPGDIETGLAPASASAEEEKNKPFLQKMELSRMEETLEPLFKNWKDNSKGRDFGDHINELGEKAIWDLLNQVQDP